MPTFIDNPEVYCLSALSLVNPSDRLRRMAVPFRDGTWKLAAGCWSSRFASHFLWERPARAEAVELRHEVLVAILSGPLDDVAFATIPNLLSTLADAPLSASEQRSFVDWLVAEAGPNEAAVVANVLERVGPGMGQPHALEWFPLVSWLLSKGSSELRSGRSPTLAAQLLPTVIAYGKPEQIAGAVRYVLYSAGDLKIDGWTGQVLERLLVAFDRLFRERPSSTALLGDLIEACGRTAGVLDMLVNLSLRSQREVPVACAEILRRLALGEIVPANSCDTWRMVFRGPFVDLHFSSGDSLRAAAKELCSYGGERRGADDPEDEAWGWLIAGEVIRLTNVLATRSAPDVGVLQALGGSPGAVARGAHRAVRDAIARAGDESLAPVLALLDEEGQGPTVLYPAMALLLSLGATPSGQSERRAPDLTAMVSAVREALQGKAPVVGGFDLARYLGRVTEVRVGDLKDERAFMVDGESLWLARGALEGMARRFTDVEEQRALAVLYAVHELVHEQQCIAEKRDVSAVRFAGAESALMHLDLGADHVAAVVVASVLPGWDVLRLKDLQGKSVTGFPATARNPLFSRVRKTLRLVGLRVDLALRRAGCAREQLMGESYGFADFAPSGGGFVALVNRPPFAVVKVGEISPADASVLFEAVEARPGAIERVDAVIVRALGLSSP